MQIKNVEKWSVSSTGSKTINLVNNLTGDRVVSAMYINPLADVTVNVTGYVSADDNTGIALSSVNIAALSKTESITEAGTYLFVVEPYYKVIIAVSGSADIIIKSVY